MTSGNDNLKRMRGYYVHLRIRMQSFLNWFVSVQSWSKLLPKDKKQNKSFFFLYIGFIQIRHAKTMPYVHNDGTSFLMVGLLIIKHCKNKF